MVQLFALQTSRAVTGSYWAHPDVLLHVAQRFIGASQGYLRPAGEYTDRSRRSTAVNDFHAVRTPADVFRTYCRVNLLSFLSGASSRADF